MRCRRIVFSAPVMAAFFQRQDQRAFQCIAGMPQGTKLIDVNFNPRTETGVLTFEHESFDPVESIEKAPFIEAQYRAYALGDNGNGNGDLANRDRIEGDDGTEKSETLQ
jgi:hypothetical protein